MGTAIWLKDMDPPAGADQLDAIILQREPTARNHWIFQSSRGTASYRSLTGRTTLSIVKQASGYSDPVIGTNYVTARDVVSLSTGWWKANGFTACVTAYYDTDGGILFGNYVNVTNGFHIRHRLTASKGHAVQWANGGSQTTDFSGGSMWTFCGASVSASTVRIYTPQSTQQNYTVSGTYSIGSSYPYFLVGGLAYGSTYGAGQSNIAEVIVFDRALSAAELAEVYTRSVSRMSGIGITYG